MSHSLNGSAMGPTIPASSETLLRFQPGRGADEPERDDAPVYLLAAPTEKLQRAFRAGLLARGLRHPDNTEIVSAIALALDEMRASGAMTDEDFDRQFTYLEKYEALAPWDVAKDGPMPRDRRIVLAGFARLVGWASEHAPYVQELEQKRLRFQAEYPLVACGIALRGWEHHAGVVEVRGHEVTAETLAHLTDDEQSAIGTHWLLQFALTAAQKKTSVSPPPSPTIPATTRPRGGRRRSAPDSVRSTDTTNGTSSTSATLDT